MKVGLLEYKQSQANEKGSEIMVKDMMKVLMVVMKALESVVATRQRVDKKAELMAQKTTE